MSLPKEVTISVTEEDIQQGRRKSIYQCPIARAIRREFQEPVTVAGFHCDVYPNRRSLWNLLFWPQRSRYELPFSAALFQTNFDIGEKVKPITFTMKKVA